MTRHRAIGTYAATQESIEARRAASATQTSILYPLALCEAVKPRQGQSLHDAQRERDELKKQFATRIHLRRIASRTYRLMIGQTQSHARLYDGKQLDTRLGKIRAQSPCGQSEEFDPRFADRKLIRTRKGRKLVQRVAREHSITLDSQYQLAQAGVEFDPRFAGIESERIAIDCEPKRESRIAGATLAQIERANPTDVDLRRARELAEQQAEAHVHTPLEVPARADAAIPSRRQIDDRSTQR